MGKPAYRARTLETGLRISSSSVGVPEQQALPSPLVAPDTQGPRSWTGAEDRLP